MLYKLSAKVFHSLKILGGGEGVPFLVEKTLPKTRLSPFSFLFISIILFTSLHERVIILCKVLEEKDLDGSRLSKTR